MVVPAKTNLANEVKALAKQILSEGPCDLDAKSVERVRYFITDLTNDLRDPRSREEAQATATQLYGAIADFFLRYNKQWSTDGKSIPRQLKKYDPEFYRRFSHAFEQLFVHGNKDDLITLSESVLEPVGGFLFDGVRIDAPTDWRR